MTYLLYGLWFLSTLAVVGELDRRWGRWICDRFLPELASSHTWFLPPAVSVAVPGAGQLLNAQPMKALLCFLWPFLVSGMPRPWQMAGLKLWWLALPWYIIVIADALVGGVVEARARSSREAADWAACRAVADDLHLFLVRRSNDKTPWH